MASKQIQRIIHIDCGTFSHDGLQGPKPDLTGHAPFPGTATWKVNGLIPFPGTATWKTNGTARERAAMPNIYFMKASGLFFFISIAERALPTMLAAMKHANIIPGSTKGVNQIRGDWGS